MDLIKDVSDRNSKILRTEFFESSIYYYSSYNWSKFMKKITVTDEKIFHVHKAFDHKNNSHADLRTSHAHLSEKGCQCSEKDSKNKVLS